METPYIWAARCFPCCPVVLFLNPSSLGERLGWGPTRGQWQLHPMGLMQQQDFHSHHELLWFMWMMPVMQVWAMQVWAMQARRMKWLTQALMGVWAMQAGMRAGRYQQVAAVAQFWAPPARRSPQAATPHTLPTPGWWHCSFANTTFLMTMMMMMSQSHLLLLACSIVLWYRCCLQPVLLHWEAHQSLPEKGYLCGLLLGSFHFSWPRLKNLLSNFSENLFQQPNSNTLRLLFLT